jgi:hypothetical protein
MNHNKNTKYSVFTVLHELSFTNAREVRMSNQKRQLTRSHIEYNK